jgi:hypothetical protein
MATMIEEKTDGTTTMVSVRLGDGDFALVERKRVPVSFLKLDPGNPRLSYRLGSPGIIATDEDLHKMLWEQGLVEDLYVSILNNGGLIEDPVVRRDGVVVEGNCRTVALRELQKKYPADSRFAEVFVKLLPDDMTDGQLMMLLGELHVAGQIRWGAFEEAEYVWKMQNVYHKTYDYLAAQLRWSRGKIFQKTAAYEETRRYIEETGDKDGVNRFSHFEEFMRKKELRDKRKKDPEFMKQFRNWVFEGKLHDSKDVRELPDLLSNTQAFAMFVGGDVMGARQVLYNANPSMVSEFYATVDRAIHELRTIPLAELEDLQKGAAAKVDKLRDLRAALDNVAKHAGLKL